MFQDYEEKYTAPVHIMKVKNEKLNTFDDYTTCIYYKYIYLFF
jgi:hypothetical protein